MSGDNIVYSTDPAWKKPCEYCGKAPCGCGKPAVKPKQGEPVRVSFKKTGKGSGMTLIEKLQMHPEGKEELLKKFKKAFGAGGTVKFGVIELQGDRRDAVEAELLSRGYKVRRIG